MIKVYSIDEIIAASEEILTRKKTPTKTIIDKDHAPNKIRSRKKIVDDH